MSRTHAADLDRRNLLFFCVAFRQLIIISILESANIKNEKRTKILGTVLEKNKDLQEPFTC